MPLSPEQQLPLFDKGKLAGWPTVEEIRALRAKQEDPYKALQELRIKIHPPSPEHMHRRIR